MGSSTRLRRGMRGSGLLILPPLELGTALLSSLLSILHSLFF